MFSNFPQYESVISSDLLSAPTTMMSEGTKNIVEAMKARGIRKVVGCMSGKTHCNRNVNNRRESGQSLCYVAALG